MKRPWQSKHEYIRISGELANSERHNFEAKALPLIRVIWPNAVGTPSSRSFDRRGVDHLAWGDGDLLRLVVQCKGFDAGTTELGPSQIKQCKRSINKFQESGLATDHYLIIHNRDGRDRRFAKEVSDELKRLTKSGAARSAELWDRRVFVFNAFEAMFKNLRSALAKEARSWLRNQVDSSPSPVDPLKTVPVRECVLTLSQHQLQKAKAESSSHQDPAKLLLKAYTRQNLVLLIGEFGLGKTLSILRAINTSPKPVFYVPAARISSEISGAKQLFLSCFNLSELLYNFVESDSSVLELLARPTIEYLLKDSDTQILLVIDGLDETAFLARRGGLQALFNMLEPIRVPVVMAMRTEFWKRRKLEFEVSYGMKGKKTSIRRQSVAMIELLPWTHNDIRELAVRAYQNAATPDEQQRLADLKELVGTSEFVRLYGDIPRRPLFLQQIIDSVQEFGLPGEKESRAQLMTKWARLKTMRDILMPVKFGGKGRISLLNDEESSEAAVEWVWEAMIAGAAKMTVIEDGELQLLSSCAAEEVLDHTPALRGKRDILSLCLHSLLQPVATVRAGVTPRIRFSHRAFQEFFTAHHILRQPESYEDLRLPIGVAEWKEELRKLSRHKNDS